MRRNCRWWSWFRKMTDICWLASAMLKILILMCARNSPWPWHTYYYVLWVIADMFVRRVNWALVRVSLKKSAVQRYVLIVYSFATTTAHWLNNKMAVLPSESNLNYQVYLNSGGRLPNSASRNVTRVISLYTLVRSPLLSSPLLRLWTLFWSCFAF